MGVFDGYLPLGLGTARFPINGPGDVGNIDKSVNLVIKALDAGVNYIDTSYTYSAGMAQTVLKTAFAKTDKPFGVTVKVMHDMDQTSDDARRRVDFQLAAMGIERADFFVCWTIPSYDVFREITRKGGIYDGALRLREEGRIGCIGCSLHTSQEDAIKILESGAFESATISHSLLSAMQTLPVLDAALSHNVDVAAMNPLGGGIIPQNPDIFVFSRGESEDTVAAALRFVHAHPAVKIILSGVSSEEELDANLRALTGSAAESNADRLSRVVRGLRKTEGFCVNCRYCDGCPKGIPVSEIMYKRNKLLFGAQETYNRTDPTLVQNINLFRETHFYMYPCLRTDKWFPDSPENPCVRCGQCEKKCTQKLKIVDAIQDIYERAEATGFSFKARKERLEELLVNKGYKRVGLYPNGGFANMIMALYERFWGKPEFEWLQFNSDPKMWGQTTGGLRVHAPEEIEALGPDVIVICSYKYVREIFESLKQYNDEGIGIVVLHRGTDVPWMY